MDFKSSSQSSSFFNPSSIDVVCKEHMFDKVVTPSDVGKLNRLVIPKQHAQRYFPLDRSPTEVLSVVDNESGTGIMRMEKGMLLNFEEDRTAGKIWRFRYSYWSSSQSYVITKGWSRFVKDKKLNSGDVISFHRAKDRLFIDWRYQIHPHQHFYFNQQRYWSAQGNLYSPNLSYFNQPANSTPLDQYSLLGSRPVIIGGYGEAYEPADQVMNMRSAAKQQRPKVSMSRIADDDEDKDKAEAIHELLDSAIGTPVHKSGEMKQLRLFGVNMKCASPFQ